MVLEKASENSTGIILAGGIGSRMGENKALKKLAGETLIERTVNRLSKSVHQIILVTNSPEEFSFLNIPMVPDILKGIGPLAGILTGLTHSATELNFFMACDLPFIHSEAIDYLLKMRGTFDLIAYQTEKGVEPFCAIYSKKLIAEIQSRIQKRNYEIHTLFNGKNAKLIHFNPQLRFYHPDLFFNVNSPDDLKKAQDLLKVKK
jgi:molybdopterin-guanine dinucleotide biosynthesis protein A